MKRTSVNTELVNEWKRWLIYPTINIILCILFYTLVLMPGAPLEKETSAGTKSTVTKVSIFLIACTSITLIAIVRIRRSYAKLAAKLASENSSAQLSPMERYAELTIRRDQT